MFIERDEEATRILQKVIDHEYLNSNFYKYTITVNDKEAGVHEVLVNVGGLGKFEIMQEADYFVGYEIEVLYNSLTVTSGTPSLFLPRYKRRRGDI